MSDTEPSAELLELLSEVARSGRSHLFRVTGEQRRLEPFEHGRRVGPSTAGLAVVERELVTAHRLELSRLLHAAFWLRFDESYASAGEIRRYFDAPDPGRWSADASAVLADASESGDEQGARELLRRCLVGGSRWPRETDLLIVSLRLADTENARNDLGVGLLEGGRIEAARRVFGDLLAGASQRFDCLAWMNLGRAAAEQGRSRAASAAFARAARDALASASVRVMALAYALMTGDPVAAEVHADAVDALGSAGQIEANWCIDIFRAAAHERADELAVRDTQRRLQRPLGKLSSEVLRALL